MRRRERGIRNKREPYYLILESEVPKVEEIDFLRSLSLNCQLQTSLLHNNLLEPSHE